MKLLEKYFKTKHFKNKKNSKKKIIELKMFIYMEKH